VNFYFRYLDKCSNQKNKALVDCIHGKRPLAFGSDIQNHSDWVMFAEYLRFISFGGDTPFAFNDIRWPTISIFVKCFSDAHRIQNKRKMGSVYRPDIGCSNYFEYEQNHLRKTRGFVQFSIEMTCIR